MADIQLEWKDVEKTLKEDEFKNKYQQMQAAKDNKIDEEKGKNAEPNQPTNEGPQPPLEKDYESMGLAEMVSEMWNDVGGEKGYELVTDKQKAFLEKHTARLEEKHFKEKMDMIPELEAALAHVVVYVPKFLKKRRLDRQKK